MANTIILKKEDLSKMRDAANNFMNKSGRFGKDLKQVENNFLTLSKRKQESISKLEAFQRNFDAKKLNIIIGGMNDLEKTLQVERRYFLMVLSKIKKYGDDARLVKQALQNSYTSSGSKVLSEFNQLTYVYFQKHDLLQKMSEEAIGLLILINKDGLFIVEQNKNSVKDPQRLRVFLLELQKSMGQNEKSRNLQNIIQGIKNEISAIHNFIRNFENFKERHSDAIKLSAATGGPFAVSVILGEALGNLGAGFGIGFSAALLGFWMVVMPKK